MRRFNAREFWHAHEAWETLWLVAETEIDDFLQGLIQLAAAYHHLQRGTLRGAVRLFDTSLRRLEKFPPQFCGLDREEAQNAAIRHRRWTAEAIASDSTLDRMDAEQYPRLHVIDSPEPQTPVNECW